MPAPGPCSVPAPETHYVAPRSASCRWRGTTAVVQESARRAGAHKARHRRGAPLAIPRRAQRGDHAAPGLLRRGDSAVADLYSAHPGTTTTQQSVSPLGQSVCGCPEGMSAGAAGGGLFNTDWPRSTAQAPTLRSSAAARSKRIWTSSWRGPTDDRLRLGQPITRTGIGSKDAMVPGMRIRQSTASRRRLGAQSE
jgi:hypothetical protein